MSKVLDIEPDQFQSEVIDFAGKVVVDFYGPKCGPCQTMTPLLDELADEYVNEVKFVKVDATQSYELAAEHGVTTVPTFLLFDNGKKQKRETGTKTKVAFYKWIDSWEEYNSKTAIVDSFIKLTAHHNYGKQCVRHLLSEI